MGETALLWKVLKASYTTCQHMPVSSCETSIILTLKPKALQKNKTQISIPSEYRCRNPQSNTSKLFPAQHKKRIIHYNRVGVNLRMQSWFNIQKLIIWYIHTTEYYLAIKRNGVLTLAVIHCSDESWKAYGKWKKPHKRPQTGWFHLYEMSVEEASLQRQMYRLVASWDSGMEGVKMKSDCY